MILQRRHAFSTITDADWAAMLRAHRALGHYRGNEMLRRIRERMAASKAGTSADKQPSSRGPARLPQA